MTGPFDGWQRPPQDVVPPTTQPTDLADMVGRVVTITVPGEPIYNAAGDWIGMTEPERLTAMLALPFDRAELSRLGLLPTDNREEPTP